MALCEECAMGVMGSPANAAGRILKGEEAWSSGDPVLAPALNELIR